MTTDTPNRDLVLTRLIPAPRAALFRAWTEPALIARWFAPRPYRVAEARTDPRPGGTSRIVMQAPDGTLLPASGVYLEVVENERIVLTDAYTSAWEPSPKPFFTLVVTFEEAEGGTLYTARARHWSEEDRAAHEAMGFHAGWGLCADQLAEVAAGLPA